MPRRPSRRSTGRSTTAARSASTRPVRRQTSRADPADRAERARVAGCRRGHPRHDSFFSGCDPAGRGPFSFRGRRATRGRSRVHRRAGRRRHGESGIPRGRGRPGRPHRRLRLFRDGRIAAVGDLAPDRIARARRRIDATGLVVAPGFIDLLGQSEYNALVDRRAASKITQGITSEVTGEGESIAPLDETLLKSNEDTYRHYGLRPDWSSLLTYFMRFRRTPPTITLGTFVGLGGLRRMVVGTEDRRAGPTELDRMKALVAQAMEDGALGVSTSLQYVPDLYNSTDEIIACAKVAASRGGVYFTHQRSEGNRIDSSLAEVFRIAREARIPANVWHLKTAYRRNWGAMPRILAAFAAARASGLDVAANQYRSEEHTSELQSLRH